MRRRTKILMKLWLNRISWCIVIFLIVWANVLRLQDNVYSNYEKMVDFGRVRDENYSVEPVIAAIFYDEKNANKGQISSYFNHVNNYKKQNVKIVVVPKKVNSFSLSVIEKLYDEIKKHNKINNVVLVHGIDGDIVKHRNILNSIMGVKNVKEYQKTEQNILSDENIKRYLNEKGNMLIVLADLAKKDKDDLNLVNEVVDFAQKKFYHLKVFDVIDTQFAKSIDKDYDNIFSWSSIHKLPLLEKQKYNLERYKSKYWRDLTNYFELNILRASKKEEPVWPSKIEDNFRLYDRGMIFVKLYDENYVEIYENGKIEQNNGIIVSLVEVAQDVVLLGKAEQVKYIKIYLLTDLEYIERDDNMHIAASLDGDDGVLLKYKNFSALLVADDLPDEREVLISILREKAKIPSDVEDKDLDFYRFKSVEIKYGD